MGWLPKETSQIPVISLLRKTHLTAYTYGQADIHIHSRTYTHTQRQKIVVSFIQNSSSSSHLFQSKSQILTMVYEVLCGSALASHLTWFPSGHSVLHTLASLLFFKYTRHISTSGSLSFKTFLCLECTSARYHIAHSITIFRFLLKCHHHCDTFLGHSI